MGAPTTHRVATVGDLEKLISQLKAAGEITSDTLLSVPDEYGTTATSDEVEVQAHAPSTPGGRGTLHLCGGDD